MEQNFIDNPQGIRQLKQSYQHLYNTSFLTKTKLEDKKSESHTFKDNPKVFIHQSFEPYTWFCDIVVFGKYNAGKLRRGVGYLLWVHANSRYMVLSTGNLIQIGETDDDLYEFKPTGLKTTQAFIASLREIYDKYTIKTIISDSEPSWNGNTAKEFYESLRIKHIPINESQEGHNRMGILDRAVRTLRDMIYNSGSDETNPVILQRIVDVYNKTKHGTLCHYLHGIYTPEAVFKNPELEQLLIKNIRIENWKTMTADDYEINDGEEVVVKMLYTHSLDKHRRNSLTGKWIVIHHSGQYYSVKNIHTNEVKQVLRSQIKRL